MKPINEIPSTVTKIDGKTGEETHEPMSWKVMPPPPGHCQICAVKHDPREPHNAQSLYYQTIFNSMIGRPATWADAIAHCEEPLKAAWERELRRMGHWSQPIAGEQPVKHHGVE